MANVIRFTSVTDEGDEVEVSLPAKYEVCSTCEGRGRHVNRAIDGNGLSREDFDEDPSFEEAYFRGDYDVVCEECGGKRVILVIDEAEAKRQGLKTDLEAYYEQGRAEASYQAECAAERRMGA
jgi:RecJ-like exonuclease